MPYEKKPKKKPPRRTSSQSTRSGNSAEVKTEKPERINQKIKAEVIILAVLAFSVLLMLCVYTESVGALGGFIKKLLFGMFGVGASVLPFAAMLGCVFAGFKKFKRTSKLKNILVCLLFLSSITIFHVMYQKNIVTDTEGPIEYISYFAKNGGNNNGGAIGAIIGGPLVKFIGSTGSYVILFTLAIICVVVITERSVFELLSSAAVKTAKTARITANKISEERKRRISRAESANAAYSRGDSIKELKSSIEKEGKNFNHKLKWGELDEYEDLSYENKRELVESNPEIFGFSKEAELVAIPDDAVTEISELSDTFETPFVSQMKPEPTIEPEYNMGREIIIENFDDSDVHDFNEDEPPFEPDEPNQDEPIKISDYLKKGEEAAKVTAVSEKLSSGVSNEFIDYVFPPIELLYKGENGIGRDTKSQMLKNAQKLEETLKSFGVIAKVVQINKGPTVTRYELTPDSGVKVSRIVGLSDDIALNLASDGIRIEAPVPGKSVVGIEVPNKDRTPVFLREVLESPEFQNFQSKVAFGVGKDIGGSSIVADISDMPHLLIAGATGAGKSVCINTLITSILYKASPNEVKLILIDPKVVELGIYDGIPHLLTPVVTSPKEAASALNWGVHEMNMRYNLFKEENVRDLKGYNGSKAEKFEFDAILPKIVIIIDELSDLMMSAPKDVEDSIMRLAQKARAAGIHLVLATQRPSVDVITGVIKANIPSRLAFAVSSGTDSRTILDMVGAEKLLGRGDMLFSPRDLAKPVRVQGAFVSDKEVESIVGFVKQHSEAEYDENIVAEITTAVKAPQAGSGEDGGDELYEEILEFVLTKKEVSVSMLQRQFRIGYNRSARIMDTLEKNGVVSENTGEGTGKPSRKVLANHGGE